MNVADEYTFVLEQEKIELKKLRDLNLLKLL